MSYVSQGTISVEFELNARAEPSSLFFVPERDYSIKHRGQNYAVFVLEGENQDASIFKKNEERGIEIAVRVPTVDIPFGQMGARHLDGRSIAEVARAAVDRSSWIAIISGILERHSKVEIKVDRDLTLTAIRVLSE